MPSSAVKMASVNDVRLPAASIPIRNTRGGDWAKRPTGATRAARQRRAAADRVATCVPMPPGDRATLGLLLDGAGGQAGRELRLERQEEEEGRQGDQGRGRHHLPPLGGVLAEERVE